MAPKLAKDKAGRKGRRPSGTQNQQDHQDRRSVSNQPEQHDQPGENMTTQPNSQQDQAGVPALPTTQPGSRSDGNPVPQVMNAAALPIMRAPAPMIDGVIYGQGPTGPALLLRGWPYIRTTAAGIFNQLVSPFSGLRDIPRPYIGTTMFQQVSICRDFIRFALDNIISKMDPGARQFTHLQEPPDLETCVAVVLTDDDLSHDELFTQANVCYFRGKWEFARMMDETETRIIRLTEAANRAAGDPDAIDPFRQILRLVWRFSQTLRLRMARTDEQSRVVPETELGEASRILLRLASARLSREDLVHALLEAAPVVRLRVDFEPWLRVVDRAGIRLQRMIEVEDAARAAIDPDVVVEPAASDNGAEDDAANDATNDEAAADNDDAGHEAAEPNEDADAKPNVIDLDGDIASARDSAPPDVPAATANDINLGHGATSASPAPTYTPGAVTRKRARDMEDAFAEARKGKRVQRD